MKLSIALPLFVIFSLFSATLASCPSCPTPAPTLPLTPPHYVPSNNTLQLPCPPPKNHCPREWNYTTAAQWGSACENWSQCSRGLFQSPVDIYTPGHHTSRTPSSYLNNGHHYHESHSANPFTFHYNPINGTYLFNTGNFFILADYTLNNTFDYNGVLYWLKRVEFHSPSEHTVNGYRYDIEMELIHESGIAGHKALAVSVFFDRGDKRVNCSQTNLFLEQIQFNLPQFSKPRCSPRNWNGRYDCCFKNCTLPICGNGILEYGEQCDQGTNNSNTRPGACRNNCLLPYCGDFVVDPYETCDDGGHVSGDGCSSTCRSECGDGHLNTQTGEVCDNGTANSNSTANACRLNCVLPSCGDGVVDNGEQCDNGTRGNGINPGQCRANCRLPYCGDGIIDPNEECDLAADNGPGSTCTSTCKSLCGDGVVEKGEDCDQGTGNNNNPNALCRTNCQFAHCGDGIIDTVLGEQCDNGPQPDIYCSSTCQQLCGNGKIDAGEQCDFGCSNSYAPNSCRPDCTNPKCGDGILDKGEECDNGTLNSDKVGGACRTNCLLPHCGDNVVDQGETCDNGVNAVGSGCDQCQSECGNGILDQGEECDYGSLNSNTLPDSCRQDCRYPRCGDGILDSLEVCDEGLRNGPNSDTCRSDCTLPYCGDGIIDYDHGEYCDDGNSNSDTTVNGCSSFCTPNLCRQSRIKGDGMVDLNLAIPKNKTAFTYEGSFTSPPCREGVEWIIFPELQFITQFQYDAFAGTPYGLNSSSRPIQELGWNRKISRPFRPPAVPHCGNGIQEGSEQCDLGWHRNSDNTANLCRKDCTLPRCGDGVTDNGEECDDKYDTPHCTSNCTLKFHHFNPYVCPSWSYSRTCGWGDLCSNWSTCDGTRPNAAQSPINFDFTPQVIQRLGKGNFSLPFHYSNTSIKLINTGRFVSYLVDAGSSITINTTTYTLNRIDFHTPSEHTINGQHATLEAQFIHTSSSGATVAVSVLYNQARGEGLVRNKFLDQFWFHLPRDSECRCGNGVVDYNEDCDNGHHNSDKKPDHCRLNCRRPFCGDGVTDRWEECDSGFDNQNTSNHCRLNCKKPFCGDGIVDFNEQCDPAVKNGPACTSNCHLLCGNGVVDNGEQCDNGANNNNYQSNACRTSCRNHYCGDGVVDNEEQCDNGPSNANGTSDSCRGNCKLPFCGDGIIDLKLGEECDGGSQCSNCKLLCGNGVINVGEQCDDGPLNANADGHCRTTCQNPSCGDYVYDPSRGEECDDGPEGSLYCTSTCHLLCGNGRQDLGEECDNGALNSDTLPNACRTNCMKSTCGDGIKDFGEQCDAGALNSNTTSSPCRLNCVLPRCGDGIVDKEEQCDDGQNVNGDGCSGTCLIECGNGRRDGQEQCDDGLLNSVLPNACRPAGFAYGGCRLPRCGDGVVDFGEQCDNGNANSDFAPNACRKNCKLPRSGDGIVDNLYGEECDDFHLDDFSGSCSTTNVLNSCRTSSSNATVDLSLAFNKHSPVLTYSGSSTNPPCSEGWTWFVFQDIQTIDETQYYRLKKFLPHESSRGPQPLNGRTWSYTASVPSVCGDGHVEKHEECDEGAHNANSPDKCRSNCVLPKCGDGILDAGEHCDEGAQNSVSGPCGHDCKWTANHTCAPGNTSCTAPGSTTINVIFANLLSGAKCTGNCPK